MTLRSVLASALFFAGAMPVFAQDDPPLPPMSVLMEGTVIFACALIEGLDTGVALFTFRRERGGDYHLLTEGRDLPATSGDGVFVAFDPERLTSIHISEGASSAIVRQVYQPMLCSNITRDVRQTILRLSRD